jgi:hypothetical protein
MNGHESLNGDSPQAKRAFSFEEACATARASSLTQHLHVYLSVPLTIIMVYDHDLLPGT